MTEDSSVLETEAVYCTLYLTVTSVDVTGVYKSLSVHIN